jgi:ubiquinone/menaquinone biosynthesis C-methylase UbiE
MIFSHRATMPLPTPQVRRIYDRRAAGFDRFVQLASAGQDLRLRRRFARQLAPPAGGLLLDVGCGTGRDLAVLDASVRFVGVDLSRGMLLRAPRESRRHYVQADAAFLPIRRGVADAVLCTYTLSTIARWRRALDEILEALRPGGRIVVTDDRLPPGWFLGPIALLRALARFEWTAPERTLWRLMRRRLTDCRRGSAFLGLIYWTAGMRPL